MWMYFHILLAMFVLAGCHGNDAFKGCAEPSCLKCGPKGCIKCPKLIVYPTRECVDTCPRGHRMRWSTVSDYMGRICAHNGNLMGLSTEGLAIFTGILAGTLLGTAVITAAVFYIKYRRKVAQQSLETGSDLDDSPERRDFLKQLEILRPFAQDYLDMLNDTRRQIRELHKTGEGGGSLGAYRPIIRDLAKVLLLVNRPAERIQHVPDDWEHLFAWAEKILKRYKRLSVISHPQTVGGGGQTQVAQLINFLQGPTVGEDTAGDYSPSPSGRSTTMSTFKPDQVLLASSSSLSTSLQDVAIKNFHSNYDSACFQTPLNPQWKFEYSLISSSSEFNPGAWKNSKEYLNSPFFLDDDFNQLGRRPQDEITTEL